MSSVERRQTERKILEKHAYINIEPNNVGMVLNVSAGGLCFHSIDPVKSNGKVRFGFSDQQQRIEGEGVLVWNDDTQKGGLRFTALSAAARDRIRDWLGQSAMSARPMASAAQSVRDVKAAEQPVSLPLVIGSPEPTRKQGRPSVRLDGFSRGLATGLMVSVFVICGFVFQGYRREFGEWLIRTGERFAAKPQSYTVAAAPPVQPVAPAPQPEPVVPAKVQPAAKTVPLPVQKVVPEKQVAVAHSSPPASHTDNRKPEVEHNEFLPSAEPVKPQVAKVESAGSSVPAPSNSVSAPAPKVEVADAATPAPLGASTSSASVTPVSTATNAAPARIDSATKPAPASQPAVSTEESKAANGPSISETFFDVGKFKNPTLAHREVDKVARLGFPVTSVQKGFLWTSSYHILVGPYGDEEMAKTTHDSLVADGFKPRTFERGSRSLTLASTVSTEGGDAPEGEYTVSWESYIGNASVKFLHNSLLVASANAKWVKRDVRYRRDAYVYRKNPDGSRTLLEIHFEGMRQALVFGKSS